MNREQREELLRLHRASVMSELKYGIAVGEGHATTESIRDANTADDAFRDYLFSLPVT